MTVQVEWSCRQAEERAVGEISSAKWTAPFTLIQQITCTVARSSRDYRVDKLAPTSEAHTVGLLRLRRLNARETRGSKVFLFISFFFFYTPARSIARANIGVVKKHGPYFLTSCAQSTLNTKFPLEESRKSHRSVARQLLQRGKKTNCRSRLDKSGPPTSYLALLRYNLIHLLFPSRSDIFIHGEDRVRHYRAVAFSGLRAPPSPPGRDKLCLLRERDSD